MKEREESPAVQRALDFVNRNLEKAVWPPGARLPSIRSIAVDALVGSGSMQKAMAKLKAQGLLAGSKGGCFRAAGGGAMGPYRDGEHSTATWRIKRVELEKDILSGVYADLDKVPSIKELQARYGTCFTTMRKILRSMVEDGVVRLRNRSYELQRSPNTRSSQRIVFITYRYPYRVQATTRTALNQGQNQVLGMFERECIRRGLKMDIVEIDFYDPRDVRRVLAAPVISQPALGYVLDLWWNPESFFRSFADLLTRLGALKRLVTILDESGDLVLPAQFARNPLFQVFRIEGKKAGARMARLLLGLGHRSVAYVSAQHFDQYSRQRLEGVTDQYDKAGRASDVHPIVTDRTDVQLLHVLALSGLDDTLLRKIISVDRTPSQTEDQYNSLITFRKSAVAPVVDARSVGILEKNLAILKDGVARGLDKGFFDRVVLGTLTEAGSIFTESSLAPLFEKALALDDVTAWICVTDATALAALRYLQRRGVAVPKVISVTGFDNEPFEAVEQRLTTFDFNAQGFVQGILNFIVRPPKRRGPYHHSPIEIGGIVVERKTTAAARRP